MRPPMRLSPVVLLLVFVSIVAPAIATAQPPGGGRGGQIRSPEIAADGTVTFRVRAPNAKEVIVVGFGQKLPMQKDEQGVWTATTDVLKPDIYTYTLLGGRRDVQRPGQPVLQDVLPRRMAEPVPRAGRGGLGSGSGTERHDLAALLHVGRRRRRPRLLRLHAARLRSQPQGTLSRPLPAARAGRRRGRVALGRRGERRSSTT